VNAAELHRRALVIDGHSDILMPVVNGVTTLAESWPASERDRWGRIVENERPAPRASLPYGLGAFAVRTAPAGQYELPLLEEGGVTAECAAIYIDDGEIEFALERGLLMAAALGRHVAEHADRCLLARSAADIRRAKEEGRVAYILTMEGAEPIGRKVELLDVFWHLGLRMTTLTHSRRNWLADGTQQDIATGGLTRLGREAVRRCEELGIVLDLAHIADQGFWEIIEMSSQPVVCSHTSLLTPAPGYRARWDEINTTYGMTKAQALARTGGLIGVIFWSMPDIAALVAEIRAALAQVGPEHVGLGTDFFGFGQAPSDLQHAGELPRLTAALIEEGFPEETILAVLGGNFLRVFEQVWTA
jgi:membrane dipeptidase